MSKSLGNFVTINEVLANWPGEVLRFNMLRAHYRQPIDWTLAGLDASINALDDFYKLTSPIPSNESPINYIDPEVQAALQDDLNTPAAIAALHKLRAEVRGASGFGQIMLKRKLTATANLFGLLVETESAWFKRREAGISIAKVDLLISARLAARAAKEWKESDRIRDELAGMGVSIKDNKDGTTSWEVKR